MSFRFTLLCFLFVAVLSSCLDNEVFYQEESSRIECDSEAGLCIRVINTTDLGFINLKVLDEDLVTNSDLFSVAAQDSTDYIPVMSEGICGKALRGQTSDREPVSFGNVHCIVPQFIIHGQWQLILFDGNDDPDITELRTILLED